MVTPAASGKWARRIARRVAQAGLLLLAIYGMGNLFLAWLYVLFLTHPACPPLPNDWPGDQSPQIIQLRTADGLLLPAAYYPARNGAAILTMGGLGSGALGYNLPPVEFLLAEGYGVLQIGSRACATPPALMTAGAKELLDGQAGLDFLLQQAEIERVGVFGFSMGGVSAIRLAARREQVAAVIAEGNYHNMGRDMVDEGQPRSLPARGLMYSIAGVFWLYSGENPFEVSPIDDIARISPRPLMLIYGSKEVAAVRGEQQFAAALAPKTLWVTPGGGHGSNYRLAQAEYRRRVLEFFAAALLPAATPAGVPSPGAPDPGP